MDDEAPVARYDPLAGTLRLRLTGGEDVTIAGLGPDLPIWRGAGEAAGLPLWLTGGQADVLGKMIGYILQSVRISEGSRAVLEELAPQVAQLKDEIDAARLADGGLSPDAAYGAE